MGSGISWWAEISNAPSGGGATIAKQQYRNYDAPNLVLFPPLFSAVSLPITVGSGIHLTDQLHPYNNVNKVYQKTALLLIN